MALLNKKPLKITDGRQAWESTKNIPAVQGPDEINNQLFSAASLNTNSMTFTVQIPSLQTGLGRRLLYHLQTTVNFTGTPISGQTNLLDGVNIGLSDMCADQVINTERIIIGSKSNQAQRSQYGVELARIHKSSKYDVWAGNYAKDFAIDFAPWENTNRNVLAKQYDYNPSDSIPAPRTSCLTIVDNTPTTAQVLVDLYFFSAVSPFSSGEMELPAIRNLDAITITLQFESDFMRLFSYDATALTLNLGTVTMTKAEVDVQFITPSPDSITRYTMEDDLYAYSELQAWLTPAQSVSANSNPVIGSRQTVSVSLPQMVGQVIPDLFIIGCRPVQNLLTQSGATRPRFWLPFAERGIRLKFNNQTVLDQMSNRQLYEMSMENGLCQTSFDQFLGRDVTFDQDGYTGDNTTSYVLGGSFIVVDPSKDLQIAKQGLCNGAIANWSLSGQITFENQSYDAENVEVVVLAVYPGWLLSNGQVNASLGLLERHEIIASFASAEAPIPTSMVSDLGGAVNGYQGGKFSFGKFLSGVASVAKKVYDNKDKILGVAKQGLDVYKGLAGGAFLGGKELKRSSYASKQVQSKYL